MCGIAGWLGRPALEPELARRVGLSLRHRGPDGQAMRTFPDGGLIHARLKVIDVSERGDQPIGNEDGTVYAVFNGEIYNHRQLRAELERKGHGFRGRSDSEVLPHLWEECGTDCVRLLRGIFAFAIHDARTGQLFLARDRFGVKPLFYAPGPARLAFASEIAALRPFPGIDWTPDAQAISDYAAVFSVPAPSTFYRGIRALEPGEYLLASRARDRILIDARRHHDWVIRVDPTLTVESAAEKADTLIDAAVRAQLESDVPMGALLSGGIDSSLVSAAARRHLGSLKTFNVQFSADGYDETWAALEVARHIGSEHSTLPMDDVPGTLEHVAGLLRHMGQPYADTSLFATHAVCRQMRQHVTVALGGDGGDEAFGGYNLFWQIERIAALQRLPALAWQAGAVLVPHLVRAGAVPATLGHRLRDFSGADDTAIIQGIFSWVRQQEHARLCRPLAAAPPRELFRQRWRHELPRRASRLERLSAYATEVNARVRLASDFLPKVDMASMREGLELRVPMLDEDLFDFGLTLPHRLKARGRVTKQVLRRVAARRLPARVATKGKQGFGIPVHEWVDAAFRGELRAALLSPASRLRDVLDPATFRPWIDGFCDGHAIPGVSVESLYQRVIMLLSLHLALESRPSS